MYHCFFQFEAFHPKRKRETYKTQESSGAFTLKEVQKVMTYRASSQDCINCEQVFGWGGELSLVGLPTKWK